MKSFFALLICGLLFTTTKLTAQYARITYPIDRSIFQQSFSGNTPVSLAFQIDMFRFAQETGLSGGIPIYRVDEMDKQSGQIVVSTPRSWSLMPGSNWSALSGLDFKGYLINDLALPKGWYRVSLGVWFSDPNINITSYLTSVSFGVGDVYFVAGQSNASGFDEGGDDVQNYAQTYPSIEQFDSVSFIKIPFENKATFENINILGIPFNPNANSTLSKIEPYFSRLNNGNDIKNTNKIYPNGRGSWYWAQFAHRMAKDRNTPVMIFNVATPNTTMSNWADSSTTTRYTQLRRTLQTYASIYGAKGILWHQGENDARDLTFTANQSAYLSNYTSQLNDMIGWSRTDLTKSTDPNTLKKLSWYVSKISFHYAGNWTVSNPSTTPADPFISSLLCNESTRPDITHKLTSSLLKNAQTNNPNNNVFRGIFADDIGECDRAKIQRIHFTGENNNLSLQKVGNRWYEAVDSAYVSESIVGQQLLPIEVERDANNNYVLKAPRKAGNVPYAKYFWVKNGDGVFDASKVLSTNPDFSTNQNNTAIPVFYICYVSDDTDPINFRLRACQPFVMKNTADSSPNSQQLRITDGNTGISAISFGDKAELKDIVIESDNLIWDAINIPSWVSLNRSTGGFNNTLVSISILPNTGSLRTHVMKVKKIGTPNEFEQFLTITQLGNTCSEINLSSLSPSNPSNEWTSFGELQFNKSIAGNTMSIGGRTFINGLGTHANSTIKYNLNGNYTAFEAYIGRDDEADNCMLCGTGKTVIFKVKTDNTLIYTSQPMGVSTAAIPINLNVAGKNTLELIVEDGGDAFYGDHANWADAKLLCNSPCSTNLTLISPTDDINGSRTKRAINAINASNKVGNQSQTFYKAGNSITLQAGFKAENATFKAEISNNPCFDNN